MSKLAINGGEKAVTLDLSDKWERPVEKQKRAVNSLIDKGFFSGSGYGEPKEFEDRFRDYLGCRYVLTVSHGHLALASAFFAAGLGAGDEFIHPANGYLGSYAGALHMGATPVFCESDPDTLLADPDDIARRITKKTRVVAPVHWHGRVCDLDRLIPLCEKHGIVLVEDAAHAHSSLWGNKRIGNVGHIACFSLQGIDPSGKPITGGEGGILATNDSDLYERALAYCHLHRGGVLDEITDPVLKKLDAQLMGWKWRAHPFELALAQVSMDTLPKRARDYSRSRDELFSLLKGIPGFRPASNYHKSTHAELYGGLQFVFHPEELEGLSRKTFCDALKAEGVPVIVETARKPQHMKPLFSEELPGLWGQGHAGPMNIPLPRYREGDYPVSEHIWKTKFGLRGWIKPVPAILKQISEAFMKVSDNYGHLLEKKSKPAEVSV